MASGPKHCAENTTTTVFLPMDIDSSIVVDVSLTLCKGVCVTSVCVDGVSQVCVLMVCHKCVC